MKRTCLYLIPLAFASGALAQKAPPPLDLTLRSVPAGSPTNSVAYQEEAVHWEAQKTAIIICDMWDHHWCQGASARVAEMAPTMNRVIQLARARGVFIIHAPSETMKAYQDTPQRRLAQQAPTAPPPSDLGRWHSLDPAQEGPLPIDDADGGCDCDPPCKGGSPWRGEIATLEIAPADAISDNGAEVYNLLQQRGIDNVILMGVHANMCVLGRPFGIRQMVRLGKHVALMRDLTDTMYNSRSRPFVSHFRGTDLVVQHIERHWCPSITSTTFTGQPAFHFREDKRPRVAFVIGEQEYDAKRTLPAFGQAELAFRSGFDCVTLQSDATDNLPGLEQLDQADLAVFFLRRRSLPDRQMAVIHRYLDSGKPLVALRTSSHAFQNWLAFDGLVLGGHYSGHHDNRPPAQPPTTVRVIPEMANHPILTGLPATEFTVASWLYKTAPLAPGVVPLLTGRVGDRAPAEPVAWVNSTRGRRVFYTSLGHPDDFQNEAFRRLLRNAILWELDMRIRK